VIYTGKSELPPSLELKTRLAAALDELRGDRPRRSGLTRTTSSPA